MTTCAIRPVTVMRKFYLGMAVIGFLITYGLGIAFFIRYGWRVGQFWDWSAGNLAGASVVADATLSTFVFWAFVYLESKRLKIKRWWAYIFATLLLGLIAPLGAFLYHREKILDSLTGRQ
jgi:Terpene cyclase DEP1